MTVRRHIQPAVLCAFLLGISAVGHAQDAAKDAALQPSRATTQAATSVIGQPKPL